MLAVLYTFLLKQCPQPLLIVPTMSYQKLFEKQDGTVVYLLLFKRFMISLISCRNWSFRQSSVRFRGHGVPRLLLVTGFC